MARPWRLQFPDAVYHITSRGNNRQAIFHDDADREMFLVLLGQAAARFPLHLFAFCLMSNHYHLFLRTPEPNLASAMHWLNATYTMRFNRRHHRLGHLFQGRYRAVVVFEESHWWHLSMYLHLNPVRAGMVPDPGVYFWSSFRDFTRRKSRFEWLKPEEVLTGYGRGEADQRRRYRRECLELAGAASDFWEELRSSFFLGTRAALTEMARRHRPKGQSQEVPAFRRAGRREVDPELELTRVAQAFQVAKAELFQRRWNHWPRMAAYFHLVEHCGMKVSAVAKRMGVGAPAVTLGLQVFRKKLAKSKNLRDTIVNLAKN